MRSRNLGFRTFLLLLLGSVLWGASLFAAAVAANSSSLVGLPDWWFLVVPITFIALGAGFVATGTVLFSRWIRLSRSGESTSGRLDVTHSWTLGALIFLMFAGAGAALTGLIGSSAFFFGCLSPCNAVEVPTDRLSAFGDVAIAGLMLFAVGMAGFLVVILAPFRRGSVTSVEPPATMKQ